MIALWAVIAVLLVILLFLFAAIKVAREYERIRQRHIALPVRRRLGLRRIRVALDVLRGLALQAQHLGHREPA